MDLRTLELNTAATVGNVGETRRDHHADAARVVRLRAVLAVGHARAESTAAAHAVRSSLAICGACGACLL